MKAISYFTSSDARQGKYGRRPNVEIPEKTESAFQLSIAILNMGLEQIGVPGFRHHLEVCCTTGPCVDLELGFDPHDYHVQVH